MKDYTRKKKALLSSLAMGACALLFCCASSPGSYLFVKEDGSTLVFLRSVGLEPDNALVAEMDFDVTVAVKRKEIVDSPVLNYTLKVFREELADAEKISVCLGNGAVQVGCHGREELFKRVDGSDPSRVLVRYSARMDKDAFQKLLMEGGDVLMVVGYPDGSSELIASEEFNVKLDDVRLMLL